MAGSAAAVRSVIPAFGVEFTGSDGGCCRGPFGELWSTPFEQVAPVRSFPSARGQVSFPGGRSEEQDLSAVETALRETMEETGIAPGFVTVAGYLDRYLTGTGFDIQPVVGLLAQGYALAPDPREVASIFEVPLAFLLDPANRRRERRLIAGRARSFYAFTYNDHEIWGATAAIIVNLADRLDAISPS